MSVSAEIKTEVRKRANFACEYCGITEIESGGELTIDHFQPQSADGGDQLENLVYACFRCNLYKSDYWTTDEHTQVFNPRTEAFDEHFWLSASGKIYAITEKAWLTIKILRLNRLSLINNRHRKTEKAAEAELLQHLQDAAKLLEQTNLEQAKLLEEQRKLLSEQQRLLKILLNIEK